MQSRSVAVIGLVLMVAFAGCSGVIPFGDEDSSPDDPNADDSNKSAETEVTYPDGFSKSGIDSEKAIDQHNKALSEHDSLTLGMNHTTPTDDGTPISLTLMAMVDFTNERVAGSVVGNAMGLEVYTMEVYSNGNTTYSYNESFGEERQYVSSETAEPITQDKFTDGDWLRNQVSNASFGEAKAITRDGEPFLRYDANNTSSVEPFVFGEDEIVDPTVEDFNATMIVNQDGIIRELDYSVTYTPAGGTQKSASGEIKYTDIDSTTVEEPSWLDEAKTQATNSSSGSGTDTWWS